MYVFILLYDPSPAWWIVKTEQWFIVCRWSGLGLWHYEESINEVTEKVAEEEFEINCNWVRKYLTLKQEWCGENAFYNSSSLICIKCQCLCQILKSCLASISNCSAVSCLAARWLWRAQWTGRNHNRSVRCSGPSGYMMSYEEAGTSVSHCVIVCSVARFGVLDAARSRCLFPFCWIPFSQRHACLLALISS